jgi:hypothetical protein
MNMIFKTARPSIGLVIGTFAAAAPSPIGSRLYANDITQSTIRRLSGLDINRVIWPQLLKDWNGRE